MSPLGIEKPSCRNWVQYRNQFNHILEVEDIQSKNPVAFKIINHCHHLLLHFQDFLSMDKFYWSKLLPLLASSNSRRTLISERLRFALFFLESLHVLRFMPLCTSILQGAWARTWAWWRFQRDVKPLADQNPSQAFLSWNMGSACHSVIHRDHPPKCPCLNRNAIALVLQHFVPWNIAIDQCSSRTYYKQN